MLIVALTWTKSRNGGRIQFHSVAHHARSRLRPECNYGSPAPIIHVRSAGKIFREVLHPKAVQIDTKYLRGKNPALGNRKTVCYLPDCRRVFVRLSEGADRA